MQQNVAIESKKRYNWKHEWVGTLFYKELCLREKLINALLYEKRMQQNVTTKCYKKKSYN